MTVTGTVSNGRAGKAAPPPQCHVKTPLLFSAPLTKLSGHNVYLKLDNLQPSGSFKIRGIGKSIQAAYEQHGDALQIISSSGGNAGLAAATAARMLSLKCTVYCPVLVPDHIVGLLEAEGATVVRKGEFWDEANALAVAAVESVNNSAGDGRAILIHPFKGDVLVQGHATMADEIYAQLHDEHGFADGQGPDVISVVVGGGGLVNGLLTGLLQQKTHSPLPQILGMQCFGANALSQSRQAGKLVSLPAITSKATSMGAKTCSEEALQTVQDYERRGGSFHSVDVTDEMAASASWRLARDHRLLVELSCGAALAPVYFARRLQGLIGGSGKNVVVIVCGGSKDTMEDIRGYRVDEESGSGDVSKARIEVDGKEV